jgi:hypothetical protein
MAEPTPETAAVPAPKRYLSGWGVAALVLLIAAAVGGLFLFLLMHDGHGKKDAMPTWPVQVGDVFAVKPGDPVIARWAAQPDNNGFLVEQVELSGQKVMPKVCALQPDYMAATGQLGGSLTVLAQARQGEWRVRWQGGDTLQANGEPEQVALNCGKDAVVLMSSAELLSWLKMQTGEPDEYPVMSNDKMYMDIPQVTTPTPTPDSAPTTTPAAAPTTPQK